MPEGFLARLPDLSDVTQTASSFQSGVGTVSKVLHGLGGGGEGSPLASVEGALAGMKLRLTVDMSGLTARLPQALGTIESAIAPGSIAFVRSIEDEYRKAQGLLEDSALARAVAGGHSPQEVALAAVQDVLAAFAARQTELFDHLIDADSLHAVRDSLSGLQALQSNFAAHRAEFLPFLSRNLLGVAPDVLRAPLSTST